MPASSLDPNLVAQAYGEALAEFAAAVAEFVGSQADPTDEIVARKADALAAAYRGAMAPFRQAILDSTSPEDAIRRVSEVYRDWTPQRVVETVNEALQIAAAQGAVRAIPHA